MFKNLKTDYRLQNGPSKGAPVLKEPTLGSMGINTISRLVNKSIIIDQTKKYQHDNHLNPSPAVSSW
jgi:hypothetical protein